MSERARLPSQIDAWAFSLNCDDSGLLAAEALLSKDERERAERFRYKRHYRRFVVRRAMRRIVLAAPGGRDPTELEFREGDGGKPELIDRPPELQFNTSHSEECGVVVTGPVALGVDIECLDRDLDYLKFATRKFTPQETKEIAAQSGDARAAAFFCCWTGKEAYIKALGVGLTKDLGSFAVRVTPGHSPGLCWDNDAGDSVRRWTFHRLCAGRYVMTIGALDEPLSVSMHALSERSLSAGRPVSEPAKHDWSPC